MSKIYKPIVLVFFFAFLQTAYAQNNTNSPYTRFGYGEIIDVNSAEQRAMGGVSFALRDKQSINPSNPASYTAVDSTTFMFDFGFTGLMSSFSDPNAHKSSFNSNIEYVNLQFPISKWLGVSAGLLPYSFSGYDFFSKDSIQNPGTDANPVFTDYTEKYNGLGGISQVYTGLSVKLFNHISLGANAYYMFGDVENTRMLAFNHAGFSAPTSMENNVISISNFRFRYGLQAFHTFKEKHYVSVGAIFENKANMRGEFIRYMFDNYPNPSDTLVYDRDFQEPMQLGIGVNYIFNNKLSVSADYLLQEWGNALFFGKTDSLNNRMKLAMGAEYIPNYRASKYGDRIRYRAGFNIHNPYYKTFENTQPLNFGISFGVGLPLRTSNTMINASLEYGKVGTKNLFREDYFKLTFNATINENWFFKRKL